MLLIPLTPFKNRHRLFVSNWAHVAIFLCKTIVGIRWQVHGRENIPAKPCVIISNHQSSWETFFLQTLFTPQTQVIKKSLLNIPFFGWAFRFMKPIAINRDDPRRALHEIAGQGTAALERGAWVLIFPEGTRVPHGKVGKFSRGGVNLARKAGRNVLPVAHNAGEFWPNDAFLKRPGTINVHIGPVIDMSANTPAQANEQSKAWIANVTGQDV